MSLELNLTGKTGIVTGGSAGIDLVIYDRYDWFLLGFGKSVFLFSRFSDFAYSVTIWLQVYLEAFA